MRLFKCTMAFVMMTFCNLVLADTSSVNETTGMGVLENDYVKAGVHIGTKVITPHMKPYVYRRRNDGIAIINTNSIDSKLKLTTLFNM